MLKLLKVFPPIRHALAYGSSILSKTPDPTRQLDFIFLVDDSAAWHSENLTANPEHYSPKARKLGAEKLAESARKAAGLHYNPYVKLEGRVCKYGVMDWQRAVEDLDKWDTFYLSARLHKPVHHLISDPSLAPFLEKNLTQALAVGLVTVPPTVGESDLYVHIAKLSFLGDPRIEEAGKIERMVEENYEEFRKLYRGAADRLKEFAEWENGVVERKENFSKLLDWVPISICPERRLLAQGDLSLRKDVLFHQIEALNSSYIRKQYRHYLKTTELRDIFAYSFRKLKKALFSHLN